MAKKVKDTSLAAYLSLDENKLSETKRKILHALSVLHEATTEEVAAYMKVEHDKVWKRFSELAAIKLIATANKRPLKSGREGYTYVLTKPIQTESMAKAFKESIQPSKREDNTPPTDIAQGTLF